MPNLIYANNAVSTLAGPISNTATSLVLQAGTGQLFRSPGPGEYFTVTMIPASSGIPGEIMWCTARSTDTLTVLRGQEGTTATAYSAGDAVSNQVTAGGLAVFGQVAVYAGNPNGNVAGDAAGTAGPLELYDTTDGIWWDCTTTGSAGSAVWTARNASITNQTSFGAFINKIRNATCAIAQRGTSGTIIAGTAPGYTLDGWLAACTGANCTFAQVAGIGRSPFAYELTGAASVSDAKLYTVIESVDAFPLAGESTVYQVKVQNNTGSSFTPTLTIKYAQTSDSWTSSTVVVSESLQSCPNGVVTQCVAYVTMPSGAINGLSISLDFGTALGGTGRNVVVADADLRIGKSGTLPLPELRSYALELLQCQRYLPAYTGKGGVSPVGTTYWFGGGGLYVNSTSGEVALEYTTPTRVAITGLTYLDLTQLAVNYRGTWVNVSSLTLNTATQSAVSLNFVPTAGAANPGEATNLGGTALALLYFTGAELQGTAL